jgi:hypothetical protein
LVRLTLGTNLNKKFLCLAVVIAPFLICTYRLTTCWAVVGELGWVWQFASPVAGWAYQVIAVVFTRLGWDVDHFLTVAFWAFHGF